MAKRSTLESVAIGGASGLAVAIGGAIKDAPYEGFDLATFVRSPIIGAVEGPILDRVFKSPNGWLLALATIATERITTESYKLIRAQKTLKAPGKFYYGEWGVPKATVVNRS